MKCDNKNHSSATDFPLDVEAYLKEEIEYGAILGPSVNNPIPECHKSPFMTREKPNSVHRHVIVDLSWPKGASVNTCVSKGSGTHLYKIDISRALRHINPGDLDLLGLWWNDAMYVNTCLPFGSRHGSSSSQHGYAVVNYVDNFIGIPTPSIT